MKGVSIKELSEWLAKDEKKKSTAVDMLDNSIDFICGSCGKVCKNKGGFLMHIRWCKGPKITEFPCSICKRVFKSKRGLGLHISKRQTPCDQEYECFHCSYKTFDCNEIFWHSKNEACHHYLPK